MLPNRKGEIFHKIISRIWAYKPYLLLFGLIICFISITGFNGLYGQDSYEYLRFTNVLRGLGKNGIHPGKYYWPVLYPVFGAVFSVFFKPLLSLQIVSIISLILSGIYLENILKILYASEIRLIRFFVFLFFLLSPYPLRASLTVMSDSLCLFFITAALYYFLKYREEKSNIFFIGFAIFATAAISTRYAAFVVMLIPAICAVYYFFKRFSLRFFLLAAMVTVLILLPYILVIKDYPIDFLQQGWLQNWSLTNLLRSSVEAQNGNEVYLFPNIIYCFFNLGHPAYCFTGILFLSGTTKVFIQKRISSVQWIIIASLSLYAFFLAGIPFQNLRFLILSFPFAIILFFPGFIEISAFVKKIKPFFLTSFFLLSLLIQSFLFARVFIPFERDNKIEKQISGELLKYDSATLYTFSIDAALRYYGFKGKIIDLWEVKVDTLPPPQKYALILFNEKQFSRVWKDKNPMLNWEYLKAKYPFSKVEDLPDNWELFYITDSGGGVVKMPFGNLN